MKGRIVILDQLGDQQAACLIVDGQLVELSVDPITDAPLPGAIYRAVADRRAKSCWFRSPARPSRARPCR